MVSFKPVTAVLRGLDVLRAVNEAREATVGSVHAATGLDKATIVRMLETLVHGGYVVRIAGRAAYAPAGNVLELSRGFDLHRSVGLAAEPILSELRYQVGWPSDLAFCNRGAMIVIQTSREQGPLSFNRKPGYRAPILSTSIGRAYVAFCREDERRDILAAVRERSGLESADLDKAEEVLAEVEKRGYAVMDDTYSKREYDDQVWAMAVPVMCDGYACASLNIMMLRNAVTSASAAEQLLPPLRAAAAKLAEVIRQHPFADGK